MDELNQNPDHKYRRPTVMLSSLNMLPAYLPTLGLGEQQRGIALSEAKLECRVVVFTSNGDSCMELLESVPQLKGCKLTRPSTPATKGEVLVVGLNAKDVLNGGPLRGFEAVAAGTPVVPDLVQQGVEDVATAIKQDYPSIALAIVECTQVSSFSDTIRHAMNVDVLDPIKLGTSALGLSVDHHFVQDDPQSRLLQVKDNARQLDELADKARSHHEVSLSVGRCMDLAEAAKLHEEQVKKNSEKIKQYTEGIKKKDLLRTQPEEGQLEDKRDDLDKLEDIIAKELAALKKKNKEELDAIVATIPNLPAEAQQKTVTNVENMAKMHKENYAKMRAQHAKNFAKMRELRRFNKVREEQIALLKKRQAQ